MTSFEIMKFEDAYIELFEKFPCSSIKELDIREGELVRENKNSIVNKNVAGRTTKQYNDDHIEEHKQYREEHKVEIYQKQKIYRNRNADLLKAMKSKKCICECGDTITANHKARHMRSKKHTLNLQGTINNI